MSQVQFAEIQTGGTPIVRWAPEHVCLAASALHVLLAALLLVRIAFCRRPLDPPDTASFLKNEHRNARGEHRNCGNCHDNPPQPRTRLALHQLLVRSEACCLT